MHLDTFYRERRAGGWVYWTYSEGLRVALNAAWAAKQISRKTARLIEVA